MVDCAPAPRRTIPIIRDSKIFVGRGLLAEIPAEVVGDSSIKASKFVIVSDENVWKLYGAQLAAGFAALEGVTVHDAATSAKIVAAQPGAFAHTCCGEDVLEDPSGNKLVITYQVPHGEGSKSREVKAAIEDFMLAHRCNRDTCMIAMGGGVVGDLVGYVAATFMRGVPVVQIPTSSTAMIDSSIGGKTAINVPAGKNLIGAFYQPVDVYADLDLLKSLGKREIVEGIAEAIKMGCIHKPKLFDLLEAHPEEVTCSTARAPTRCCRCARSSHCARCRSVDRWQVMSLEPALINEVIYQSVLGKAEVVAAATTDKGLRVLNVQDPFALPMTRGLRHVETRTHDRLTRQEGAVTLIRRGDRDWAGAPCTVPAWTAMGGRPQHPAKRSIVGAVRLLPPRSPRH